MYNNAAVINQWQSVYLHELVDACFIYQIHTHVRQILLIFNNDFGKYLLRNSISYRRILATTNGAGGRYTHIFVVNTEKKPMSAVLKQAVK